MAETYRVELGAEGDVSGSGGVEEFPLSDFGYSDEEWDALEPMVQENLLNEWAAEDFWNRGFGYWGEVKRG